MSLYEDEEPAVGNVQSLTYLEKQLDNPDVTEQEVINLISMQENEITQKQSIDLAARHFLTDDVSMVQKKKSIRESVMKNLTKRQMNQEIVIRDGCVYRQIVGKVGLVELINFVVLGRNILHDENDDQTSSWIIESKHPRTGALRTAEVVLNARSFINGRELQQAIFHKFSDVRVTDNPADFKFLIKHINDVKNVPVYDIISRSHYGFSKIGEHDVFLSGNDTLHLPDGVEPPEDASLKYTANGLKNLYMIPEKVDLPSAKEFVHNFIHMNDERKTVAVLGWMAASTIEHHMERIYGNVSLPILFMYGIKEVGKSVLIGAISKAMGWVGIKGKGKEIGITATSTPEIRDMLFAYPNMPIILGEYRNSDIHKARAIGQYILSTYDKFGSSKKGERKMGAERSSILGDFKSPMVILGNDYVEDEAVSSRVLRVELVPKDIQDDNSREAMLKAQSAPAGCFGAALYKWILNNPTGLEEICTQALAVIVPMADKKTGRDTNAALAVVTGLLLVEKIMPGSVSSHQIRKAALYTLETMQEKQQQALDRQFAHYLVENYKRDMIAYKFADKDQNVMVFHTDAWLSFRDRLKREGVSEVPPVITISKQVQARSNSIWSKQTRIEGDNKNHIHVDLQKAKMDYGIDPEDWLPMVQ